MFFVIKGLALVLRSGEEDTIMIPSSPGYSRPAESQLMFSRRAR
jgi:hypothetical protein